MHTYLNIIVHLKVLVLFIQERRQHWVRVIASIIFDLVVPKI